MDTILQHRLGDLVVTRIGETSFGLPPETLFPEWNPTSGARLQYRLGADSLDLDGRNVPLQTHLWVVQRDGLTLVVDTGIGNAKSRPFSDLFDRLDNPVLERLERTGIRREQVDYVLLTHLHVDHVGWNTHWRNGCWEPVFPNATYVFSEAESRFFSTPAGEPRRMVFQDSVLPLLEAGLTRSVGDAGEEVIEGVRFLPTPGHSIGHMAICIHGDDATALFSGDVMHSPLQVYRPEWSSTFCLYPEQARRSRQSLLDYALETDAVVFAAHFPETSAGSVRRNNDGLEWQYRPADSSRA